MTSFVNELRASSAAGGIARIMNPVSRFGPRIMLEAPNDLGNDDAAAKAAADKAAADKAAADKAAADKAAADKAEADRLAAEQNGMSESEKKLLREVMEKKTKLKEETAERERLAAELKKFEGIDPEAVKKLLDDNKARELSEAEKKGEFDRVKKMMADDAAAREKALQDQITALSGEKTAAMKTIDKLTIGRDFASSTFIATELVLTPEKARVVYGSHFELKDGKTVAYDKPAGESDRTILHGADGAPLSFDEALKKIVELDPEREQLLKVKMKPGGGSNSQQQEPNKNEEKTSGLYGVGRIAAALAKKAAAA
ncbi:hypothetical protein NKH72_22345 [Mesorhizobium sp. M0955]|uniref:DUF6651 domain-containing protein n=1 Tax=Mesorhizobium sp. M0955 TaxID=2957033 RepID=UPI00333CD8C9